MKYSFFITLLYVLSLSCVDKKRQKTGASNEVVKQETIYFKNYPQVQLSSGMLMRLDSLSSKYIKPRPIDIWLPENYSKEKKYATLYMHDGQMLFDSTTTWNKQEWKLDEWASKLMNSEKTKDFIVVAVHNISDERWQDLFPQKAFEYLSEEEKVLINQQNNSKQDVKFNGNNYLKFLVEDLKPIVDSEFSTYKNRDNTFVMGSSMGGLMSMYAICEYPEVFGGAACLSTHWPGAKPIENNPIPWAIIKYMESNLPDVKTHKLYFDYGTETLDAYYPKYASTVTKVLMSNGYSEENFKNLKFEGANHSENAWNERLDVPLIFLLGKN